MDFIPLWSEAIYSHKLISLTAAQTRAWLNLVLIAKTMDGKLPRREALRHSMWPNDQPPDVMIDDLVNRKLLDEEGGVLAIHDWHHWHQKAHTFPISQPIVDPPPTTLAAPGQPRRKPAAQEIIQLAEERWFNNGGREIARLIDQFQDTELVKFAMDQWFDKPEGKKSLALKFIVKVCVNHKDEFAAGSHWTQVSGSPHKQDWKDSEPEPDYPILRASDEMHARYARLYKPLFETTGS